MSPTDYQLRQLGGQAERSTTTRTDAPLAAGPAFDRAPEPGMTAVHGRSGSGATARESECTRCPPWVVRCAHWEGRIVVMAHPVLLHPSHEIYATYGVWTGEDYALHESCPDQYLEVIDWPSLHTNSEQEAHAEFDRCEALLLGREVPA